MPYSKTSRFEPRGGVLTAAPSPQPMAAQRSEVLLQSSDQMRPTNRRTIRITATKPRPPLGP